MRIMDVIERSRIKNDKPFAMPDAPGLRTHRRAYDANHAALEDVVWTLNHQCPPPTRQGLAVVLVELSQYELEIQARDALVRLAAWAIKGATRLDDRRAHAHDVC